VQIVAEQKGSRDAFSIFVEAILSHAFDEMKAGSVEALCNIEPRLRVRLRVENLVVFPFLKRGVVAEQRFSFVLLGSSVFHFRLGNVFVH
jgi:hypothetical protein